MYTVVNCSNLKLHIYAFSRHFDPKRLIKEEKKQNIFTKQVNS